MQLLQKRERAHTYVYHQHRNCSRTHTHTPTTTNHVRQRPLTHALSTPSSYCHAHYLSSTSAHPSNFLLHHWCQSSTLAFLCLTTLSKFYKHALPRLPDRHLLRHSLQRTLIVEAMAHHFRINSMTSTFWTVTGFATTGNSHSNQHMRRRQEGSQHALVMSTCKLPKAVVNAALRQGNSG